jgi:hypothetical protein
MRVDRETGQQHSDNYQYLGVTMRGPAFDVIGWAVVIIVFGGMAIAPFLPCH